MDLALSKDDRVVFVQEVLIQASVNGIGILIWGSLSTTFDTSKKPSDFGELESPFFVTEVRSSGRSFDPIPYNGNV